MEITEVMHLVSPLGVKFAWFAEGENFTRVSRDGAGRHDVCDT